MLLNFEEKKLSHIDALNEANHYYKDIHTAITEKKNWRLCALLMLMVVMLILVLLVKPLCVAFLTKWFIETWGFSLIVSKGAATCIVSCITTQVRKGLKFLVKKINY